MCDTQGTVTNLMLRHKLKMCKHHHGNCGLQTIMQTTVKPLDQHQIYDRIVTESFQSYQDNATEHQSHIVTVEHVISEIMRTFDAPVLFVNVRTCKGYSADGWNLVQMAQCIATSRPYT
jgi:hypothetical protein